jgi:hypothetical protein
MKSVDNIFRLFSRPALSKQRIWVAFVVAVLTDAIQLGLGPLGWVFVDEGLDIIAMILISAALGFHMLLLPTFVIELIPGPDMLPTWTGCTAAVVMLRKRAQQKAPPPIEIASEVTRMPADEVTQADKNGRAGSGDPAYKIL